MVRQYRKNNEPIIAQKSMIAVYNRGVAAAWISVQPKAIRKAFPTASRIPRPPGSGRTEESALEIWIESMNKMGLAEIPKESPTM